MGSPPPAGSKNDVFRFRSVRSIVMAPARTGSDRSSRITVKNTAHVNRGIRSRRSPFVRILSTVEMKFTAPKMDEAPAKCNEKMAMSTDGPA